MQGSAYFKKKKASANNKNDIVIDACCNKQIHNVITSGDMTIHMTPIATNRFTRTMATVPFFPLALHCPEISTSMVTYAGPDRHQTSLYMVTVSKEGGNHRLVNLLRATKPLLCALLTSITKDNHHHSEQRNTL
jgi:hypothetical protein